ncbi:hypothetical protein BaRGS_00037599, partial [Batillaria attramentaria]
MYSATSEGLRAADSSGSKYFNVCILHRKVDFRRREPTNLTRDQKGRYLYEKTRNLDWDLDPDRPGPFLGTFPLKHCPHTGFIFLSSRHQKATVYTTGLTVSLLVTVTLTAGPLPVILASTGGQSVQNH